jgi:hypothetical protein
MDGFEQKVQQFTSLFSVLSHSESFQALDLSSLKSDFLVGKHQSYVIDKKAFFNLNAFDDVSMTLLCVFLFSWGKFCVLIHRERFLDII